MFSISFQDFNSPLRFSNREESLGPAPDVWTDPDSEKKVGSETLFYMTATVCMYSLSV